MSLSRRGNRILTVMIRVTDWGNRKRSESARMIEIPEAVQLDWEIWLTVVEFRTVYLRLDAYDMM